MQHDPPAVQSAWGGDHTKDGLGDHGLAAPTFADQPERAPRRQCQADVIDRFQRPEVCREEHLEMLDLDDRRRS